MGFKDWFKPAPSELSATEFGEQLYLVQHHVSEANKAKNEAALIRGRHESKGIVEAELLAQKHIDHAYEAAEKIGCVAVRISGNITKYKEEWTKGTKGVLGSSHPYTKEYQIEVYRSLREVWFTVHEDRFFGTYSVIGHLEYNGSEATFRLIDDKIMLTYVGKQ